METRAVFLLTILALALVSAKPIPGAESDLESLTPEDTRHSGYAFWFGLPIYEQDDDGYNGYSNFRRNRQPATVSYADVGAGWGR